MRCKLTIAYNGTPYKGWQSQPKMVTVQQTLEDAISEIAKTPMKIYGSGRTDTGVHADGQVAHFDTPQGSRMLPENWLVAVNTRLPSSVRLMDCEEVSNDFHARFSAPSKTYEYLLETSRVVHPHDADRVWHIPRGFDPEVLAECLTDYVGEHDFRHFCALRGNESAETSYCREISEAAVQVNGSRIKLTYSANGFLYKMVRILTGVSVSVACGRVAKEEFRRMLTDLESEFNTAKLCAPAAGLSLKEVKY